MKKYDITRVLDGFAKLNRLELGRSIPQLAATQNPFRYVNSSPEVIRLAVMMYTRCPLSLRQVEDLLFKRGIDNCHETVRFWCNQFGPLFAMAGFRDIKTLQKFASAPASIHNHFNRHIPLQSAGRP